MKWTISASLICGCHGMVVKHWTVWIAARMFEVSRRETCVSRLSAGAVFRLHAFHTRPERAASVAAGPAQPTGSPRKKTGKLGRRKRRALRRRSAADIGYTRRTVAAESLTPADPSRRRGAEVTRQMTHQRACSPGAAIRGPPAAARSLIYAASAPHKRCVTECRGIRSRRHKDAPLNAAARAAERLAPRRKGRHPV